MDDKQLRRPMLTWKGELPVVVDGKNYIPDNYDRASRVVEAMIRVCGPGFEAQQTLYGEVYKQLRFAQRDCGHDACQHVWKKALLDSSMACIRCGMSHDSGVN